MTEVAGASRGSSPQSDDTGRRLKAGPRSASLADLAALAFFLARRSLLRSRLTMALLIGAVAAGTGFQIPNAANMRGYRAELIEEGVTQWLGDVRVRPVKEATFKDGDALADRRARDPKVRTAVPLLWLPGAAGKGARFFGAPVIGIPAGARARPFRLIEGSLLERGDDKGVLLGSAFARRLGAKTGDTIKLRVVLDTQPVPLPDESLGRYSMVVRGVVGGALGSHESIFVDLGFLAEEAGDTGSRLGDRRAYRRSRLGGRRGGDPRGRPAGRRSTIMD